MIIVKVPLPYEGVQRGTYNWPYELYHKYSHHKTNELSKIGYFVISQSSARGALNSKSKDKGMSLNRITYA